MVVICLMNTFWHSTHIPADTNEVGKTVGNRHILLIRHGRYFKDGTVAEEKKLTNTGMRQADLTGRYLAKLCPKVTNIFYYLKLVSKV